MAAKMHIIPFSHYNEKGMWILDFKGVEYDTIPLKNPRDRSEIKALTCLTGTTPCYVGEDGTVIGDTTELALHMEERIPEPRLIPADEPARGEVLLWEDWADNSLGVHLRRALFYHLWKVDPETGRGIFFGNARGFMKTAGPTLFPIIMGSICKALGADEEGHYVSDKAVYHAVRLLDHRLEGRRYLVGDRFTLADLTVCALLFPIPAHSVWRDEPAFQQVLAWRKGICEAHGRRLNPAERLPDKADRARRGREAALATTA